MRAVHDPLATADRCPGCVVDPGGFDHVEVLARRPSDFDAQVVAIIREGLKLGHIAGVTLGPAAPSMARSYLREIGAEPRKARNLGRAA